MYGAVLCADLFGRFGDIPGVSYQTPDDVDRLALACDDAVPEVEVYEDDGQVGMSLWLTGDGLAADLLPRCTNGLSPTTET